MKVPIYRQPKDSMLCGPYCLKMLYHYYGKRLSIDDILSGLKIYRVGTYATQLGTHLIENGFDVRIKCWDSRIFVQKHKKMKTKSVLNSLKNILDSGKKIEGISRRGFRFMVRFLEAGGKVELNYTKERDITEALKSGNPPILCIERKSLYGNEKGEKGHFVIVSGADKKNFIINDSGHGHGGIKKYPKEDLMFALHSYRGYGLFAKPV